MNDMSPAGLPSASPKQDAIPFAITNTGLIPSKRYYDEEFYRLEQERLWPHIWQMACRLEEIPEVGDFVEYKIFHKSVIIVRSKTGVKAFHNACRHRGVQLVEGHGNCKKTGFICPFHGWRYNIEGENTFVFAPHVFDDQSLLEKAEINLAPCRLDTWAGMAFINFDDSAPPLHDCLGPVAERMDVRNVDQLQMEWWYGTVLPTNWKLAMEAFMEGYHVMRTHPQLNNVPTPVYVAGLAAQPPASSREAIKTMSEFLVRLSDGMAGMIHSSEAKIAQDLETMELPDDPNAAVGAYFMRLKDEIHQQGVAKGLATPDINHVDTILPHRQVEFVFPHFFLLPFFSAMSAYRIRPLGPETCLFEIWSLAFLPDDPARVRPTEPTMLAHDSKDFPEIPQQDYSNLPLQQRGLHAGGFDDMRLAGTVEGLISNYQRLIDGYLTGVEPDKLAKASQIVNDGYEHPIADLGFGV